MSLSRRPGVSPKPAAEVTSPDDLRALEIMGELLDLGVTPERAAETMTMLAQGRSTFVTELKKSEAVWKAERSAAAEAEVIDPVLPDFLSPDGPLGKPDANLPHSSLRPRRLGVRK